MNLTRQKNDPDLPDLYKDFGTIQKQNRSRDSFSDQDIDRQNALDARNWMIWFLARMIMSHKSSRVITGRVDGVSPFA